ncbi:MAG: GatB/YqeY domain-containing protein [Sphingomonadaceae bacterium]|nr:GatB/YqeY domain-containing protein [Sphingomonadaceae bacterium]
MIRDDVKAAEVAAMKAGDRPRAAAARQILARIKDRDIELRPKGGAADDDAMVVELLQKMVKQRRESIAMYETGGRQELADAEAAEIAVIEEFLPAQLSDAELDLAIDAIVTESGAAGLAEMGRVMALVKARHGGQIDMARASAMVRARLAG